MADIPRVIKDIALSIAQLIRSNHKNSCGEAVVVVVLREQKIDPIVSFNYFFCLSYDFTM